MKQSRTEEQCLLLRALGREFARRREEQGLTQRELSARTGVHANAISRLERGLTNVSVLIVHALANELDCDLPELFSAVMAKKASPLKSAD